MEPEEPPDAAMTVCTSTPEVLEGLLESPLYTAVSEWLPTESEAEKEADPPVKLPIPMVLRPSLKVTEPLGLSPTTSAVKVTDCMKFDGFKEEAREVVED